MASWLAALVALAGCSSTSGASGDTASDAATSDVVEADAGVTEEQTEAFGTTGGSLAVNQQATAVADQLFDFDPTIDPASSPSQNAAAIGTNTRASLGASCGTVTVTGATVTVSFGAPPGCTLKSGAVVSGTVDLGVTQSGSATTVAMTFVDVVANGQPLSGTASFVTTNGTTFTVTSNFTSGTKTDAADLTVVGASGSFTISGTSQVTQSGVTSKIVFTGVTVAPGQCYASAGSMAITTAGVTETLEFNAQTPATGQVTLVVGKRTTTGELMAYGACPTDGATSDAGGRDASREASGMDGGGADGGRDGR